MNCRVYILLFPNGTFQVHETAEAVKAAVLKSGSVWPAIKLFEAEPRSFQVETEVTL